jgi:hypothetical protein
MAADRQFLPPSKTFIRLGHSQRLIVCAHGLVPDQGTVDSVGATWFYGPTRPFWFVNLSFFARRAKKVFSNTTKTILP